MMKALAHSTPERLQGATRRTVPMPENVGLADEIAGDVRSSCDKQEPEAFRDAVSCVSFWWPFDAPVRVSL